MFSESLAARNPGTKGGKTRAYDRICVTLKMFKSNLNLKKVRCHIKCWVPLWLPLNMVTSVWAERSLYAPAGPPAQCQGLGDVFLHTQGPHFSTQTLIL